MDRGLIDALVLGAIAWYFTRDLVATLSVAGASYVLRRI